MAAESENIRQCNGIMERLHLKTAAVLVTVALTAGPGCTAEEPEETPDTVLPFAAALADISLDCSPFNSLDIFFFDDDGIGRLDSYQRIDNPSDTVTGASRSGAKTVAVIADSGKDKYYWAGINSFSALSDYHADLAHDSPDNPVRSGKTTVVPGNGNGCRISLRPVLAEIVLKTIKADFSARPYSTEKLKNARVYLTNIRTEFPVFGYGEAKGRAIENYGGLDMDYAGRMDHPEMILAGIEGDIGPYARETDIRLCCYPDNTTEESIGSPMTRLVIEGEIAGERYYYPIDINRSGGGIARNCRYEFDVVITGRGSKDPDSPVSSGYMQVVSHIVPWDYAGSTTIHFRPSLQGAAAPCGTAGISTGCHLPDPGTPILPGYNERI